MSQLSGSGDSIGRFVGGVEVAQVTGFHHRFRKANLGELRERDDSVGLTVGIVHRVPPNRLGTTETFGMPLITVGLEVVASGADVLDVAFVGHCGINTPEMLKF